MFPAERKTLNGVGVPFIPSPDDPSFEMFSQVLLDPRCLDDLAANTGVDRTQVETWVSMAVGEAAQTLRILQGIDVPPDGRVLEVGAGLGVTSAYLASRGFDVTALEPGGIGFESYVALGERLATVLGAVHERLVMPAERLDPAAHGRFDLVYSNNVVEHVADASVVLAAALSVCAPNGVAVHSCANYAVPYEPHFGIPLVPFRPRWTTRVLPRSITGTGLWQSLNFITANDVRRAAVSNHAQVVFRSAALAASVHRLGTDEQFRSRHRALAGVAGLLIRMRVTGGLSRIPATWSTPMDFAMLPPGSGADVETWRTVYLRG